MTRRDGVTIVVLTVITLVTALVVREIFTAGPGDGAARLPMQRTAVLPDPPPVEKRAPLLRARVLDHATGARLEDWSVLHLVRPESGDTETLARGFVAGTPLEVSEATMGVPLRLTLARPGYLDAAPRIITLEAGRTHEAEIRLEALHAVAIRAEPVQGPPQALLGVARIWPLPQWPADRPLVRWAEREGEHFRFELPHGRYVCCMPSRELRRDMHGRRWLSAQVLQESEDFAIPFSCHWGECEVVGAGDLEVKLAPAGGTMRLSGKAMYESGALVPFAELEAVRIGPGPFREVLATALCDRQGRFEFGGLCEGRYEIRARDMESMPPLFVEIGGEHAPIALTLRETQTGETTGVVRVQILREGKPLEGSQLVLLSVEKDGASAGAGLDTTVGEGTGFAGLYIWNHVDPGDYTLSALPRTLASQSIRVRAGMTARAVIETAPRGTGAINGFLPLPPQSALDVFDAAGKHLATIRTDAGGRAELWGLHPGKIQLRRAALRQGPPDAEAMVFAGQVAELKWITPEEDLPLAPDDSDKDGVASQDNTEDKKPDKHDRPIGGVTIRLPAPAAPVETSPPRQVSGALFRPGDASRAALPAALATVSGDVQRVILETDPADPALWSMVLKVTVGDARVALPFYRRCDLPTGSLWAGLSSEGGKAVLVLRGELAGLDAVTLLVSGYGECEFKAGADNADVTVALSRR